MMRPTQQKGSKMRNLKTYGFVGAVVALMVLVGTSRAGVEDLNGKDAPDFTLTTLDGSTAKLSDQKGKVVVLDFWATWCPPCIKALPHVQKLSADKELADKGLVVWAVNAGEPKAKAEAFLKKNNYTFAVPLDTDNATLKAYEIQGIPTQIVVGRDGKVVHVGVGYGGEAGDKKLDDAIKAALEK
jgi:peroxiredoxin